MADPARKQLNCKGGSIVSMSKGAKTFRPKPLFSAKPEPKMDLPKETQGISKSTTGTKTQSQGVLVESKQ